MSDQETQNRGSVQPEEVLESHSMYRYVPVGPDYWFLFVCKIVFVLFDLIICVPSTIFQL